jgi:chemotaxis protein MotB
MADDEPQIAPDEPEEGAPEWMVTFGDLMSLLLTFFVLLLSFSQMDTAKFKELAGSLERAFGVQQKNPVYETPKGMKISVRDFDQAIIEQAKIGDNQTENELLDDTIEQLRQMLAPLEAQGLVELDDQDSYLVLRLLGHVTFDSGKAELKPGILPTLRTIGELVGETQRDVFVAGHTDNVPIRGGPYRSNLELSVARAASVVDFFLHERLLPPNKIATMGFGEYRPLVPNDSEANRRKNRRVEIILAALRPPGSGPAPTPFPLSTPFLLSPDG